ncbi:MAG: serine hydrolase [Phycisphaerae bacterium]|nr:serine hydrolase [Phycisphaerae bacterium]
MKRTLLVMLTGVLVAVAVAQAKARPADGTAPEQTTLNLKSKFNFIDRSEIVSRGKITYTVPKKRDDGIEVADARKYGVLTKLMKLLNEIEQQNQDFKVGKGAKNARSSFPYNPKIRGCIDSVLIAKDGKLIVEEYFANADIDKPHYQMSITKSIVAYAIGKAIELGKIKSENDLILDYLPEVDRSKVAEGVDTLTLKDLLTMNSGIRYKSAKKRPKITLKNHAQLYLTLTTPIPAKKKYKYDGTNVDLLCHILHNTTGMTLTDCAKKHLFGPMGITNFKFGKSWCGLDKGAAGMRLTSRDMLKVGLMTMNGGKWNGKQILNKVWIDKATAVHVNKDRPSKYGYFW